MFRWKGLVDLFLIFIVFATMTVVASAQVDELDRKEIELNYQKISQALKDKDLNTAVSFYAKDYQVKTSDGKTSDRNQITTTLKQLTNSANRINTTTKINKMAEGKGEDEVQVEIEETSLLLSTGADGKEHENRIIVKSVDYWEFMEGQRWKLKRREIKEERRAVDGKPLQ